MRRAVRRRRTVTDAADGTVSDFYTRNISYGFLLSMWAFCHMQINAPPVLRLHTNSFFWGGTFTTDIHWTRTGPTDVFWLFLFKGWICGSLIRNVAFILSHVSPVTCSRARSLKVSLHVFRGGKQRLQYVSAFLIYILLLTHWSSIQSKKNFSSVQRWKKKSPEFPMWQVPHAHLQKQQQTCTSLASSPLCWLSLFGFLPPQPSTPSLAFPQPHS